jgi:hypothetical protein
MLKWWALMSTVCHNLDFVEAYSPGIPDCDTGCMKAKKRSLGSDHPVNPVHPVQFLDFRSNAKKRSLRQD